MDGSTTPSLTSCGVLALAPEALTLWAHEAARWARNQRRQEMSRGGELSGAQRRPGPGVHGDNQAPQRPVGKGAALTLGRRQAQFVGMKRLSMAVVLCGLVGCGPSQSPEERIKAACEREFGPDEVAVNDCRIRLSVELIVKDKQERMDRARRDAE